MATFDLGINGVGQGAAEGREAWSKELPPTGVYTGVLRVLSTGLIAGNEGGNQGKPKLSVGVELRDTPQGKYDGYLAWGNLNMLESSVAFVNQFLWALTDGSDEQKEAVEKAFYTKDSIKTDERKRHIEKFGAWVINSPEGELPIKISLTNKPFHNVKTGVTTQQVGIASYLIDEVSGGPDGKSASGTPEVAVEDEPVEVEIESEDEDVQATDDEKLLDA